MENDLGLEAFYSFLALQGEFRVRQNVISQTGIRPGHMPYSLLVLHQVKGKNKEQTASIHCNKLYSNTSNKSLHIRQKCSYVCTTLFPIFHLKSEYPKFNTSPLSQAEFGHNQNPSEIQKKKSMTQWALDSRVIPSDINISQIWKTQIIYFGDFCGDSILRTQQIINNNFFMLVTKDVSQLNIHQSQLLRALYIIC